ncbi:MAG: hypothetical protein PHF51_04540 [Candidatus ainarchaeum sp.]|nr:hypothetical protein [Candidatus ainarchaeum sp.]
MTKPKTAKGFFFTLLVVILFFFLFVLAKSYMATQQAHESLDGIKARASAMKSFVESMDSDANRMARLAGSRAAASAGLYASNNLSNNISSASAALASLAFNNTLNGTTQCFPVPSDNTCAPGSTTCCFGTQSDRACLSLWSDGFVEKAEVYGMNASFADWSISVSTGSPFNLSVSVAANFTLNDSSAALSFGRVESVHASAPIDGAEDPTYPLFMGNASYHRRILQPPAGYQLARLLYNGSSGGSNGTSSGDSGWAYGSAANINTTTSCSIPAGDKTKILVVSDINASCSEVNDYAGVLFNANLTPLSSVTVPWMNFSAGTNISNLLSNGTRVLMNNDGARHEVLDVENLRSEINGSAYYRPSASAPDFILRLENRTGASANGIASLINRTIAVNKSCGASNGCSWSDFYYFNSTLCSATPGGCVRIRGAPNCTNQSDCGNNDLLHFVIDCGSVPGYGLGNVTNVTCPN